MIWTKMQMLEIQMPLPIMETTVLDRREEIKG